MWLLPVTGKTMTNALMEPPPWSLPANAENAAEKTRTMCSANTASGTTPHRDSNRNTPTGYPPTDTQVQRGDDPGSLGVGPTHLGLLGGMAKPWGRSYRHVAELHTGSPAPHICVSQGPLLA